ncbi:zinc transporter ZupT [Mesorhizobium sangaii]|uniref:Zinc transporter ZupT n=2 Tax=Mesorhizobium sangaii TaxID=505389 RepID=A0A841PFR5_9HYPH|nr:zinc transporter ZupT [Mesorhizobium sangaii]
MLASLIAGLASGETVAAMRRARTAAIVYGLAISVALCGLGFLVGAAYIWTASRYGSLAAALGFGAGFLLLAGLILLVFQISAGSRARRRAQQRNADMKAIGITAALAVLPALLKGKGGLGVILGPAVALAAYAIYRENVKSDDSEEGERK